MRLSFSISWIPTSSSRPEFVSITQQIDLSSPVINVGDAWCLLIESKVLAGSRRCIANETVTRVVQQIHQEQIQNLAYMLCPPIGRTSPRASSARCG